MTKIEYLKLVWNKLITYWSNAENLIKALDNNLLNEEQIDFFYNYFSNEIQKITDINNAKKINKSLKKLDDIEKLEQQIQQKNLEELKSLDRILDNL